MHCTIIVLASMYIKCHPQDQYNIIQLHGLNGEVHMVLLLKVLDDQSKTASHINTPVSQDTHERQSKG